MKQKLNILLGAFYVIAQLLFFSSPAVAQTPPAPSTTQTATTTTPAVSSTGGATQQSIKNYLCAPSEGNSNTGTDFYTCINKLYRFGIAIGLVFAVLFITIAGYMYMGGSEESKKKGKEYIASTFAGILILLLSYVLLQQINPNLVKFKSIQPPAVTDPCAGKSVEDCLSVASGTLGSGGGGGPSAPGGGSVVAAGCSAGIVSLSQYGVPSKSGARACQTFAEKLQAFYQQTGGGWLVTDALGSSHNSLCHTQYGTCADIVPTNGSTVANYVSLCQAAQNFGFGVLNETYNGSNLDFANAVAAGGCSAPCKNNDGSLCRSTGPHLHIIMSATGMRKEYLADDYIIPITRWWYESSNIILRA